MKHTLKVPVEVDGHTYDEITMRKPRGRDLGKLPIEAKEMGDMFPFLASICDVEQVVIEALDWEDLNPLMQGMSGFLSSGPTGNTR